MKTSPESEDEFEESEESEVAVNLRQNEHGADR